MFRDPVVRVLVGVALVTALGFAPTAAAGGSDPSAGSPALVRAAWAGVDEALGSVRWLFEALREQLTPSGLAAGEANAVAAKDGPAPAPSDNGGSVSDPDG